MKIESIVANKLKKDIEIEEENHGDYEYLTIWSDDDFEKCNYKLLRQECHNLGVEVWKAIDYVKMCKSENEKKDLLNEWNEHKIYVYYPLYVRDNLCNHPDTRDYIVYESYSN